MPGCLMKPCALQGAHLLALLRGWRGRGHVVREGLQARPPTVAIQAQAQEQAVELGLGHGTRAVAAVLCLTASHLEGLSRTLQPRRCVGAPARLVRQPGQGLMYNSCTHSCEQQLRTRLMHDSCAPTRCMHGDVLTALGHHTLITLRNVTASASMGIPGGKLQCRGVILPSYGPALQAGVQTGGTLMRMHAHAHFRSTMLLGAQEHPAPGRPFWVQPQPGPKPRLASCGSSSL